jgi:amidase
MARVHGFTDDALGEHDAVGLVAELSEGRVGTGELVEAAIARTRAVNPALNGLAYADFDGARARAGEPHVGFFAGVPSFLKDNVDVEGMPTGQGADAFERSPARRDGEFARMFLATGLIPLGKTQMSEFGWSASAEHPRLGAVRTPWDTFRTAGASSAGSGALVAAGAVPMAHGNDGGGSIRIPAAVNGLVGLKPTRDRLAQDKMMRQMPVRIVSDGVLTRTVRDTAAFFRESEKVFRNTKLAPVGDITRPGRKRLRVGFATDGLGHSASAEVRQLTLDTAGLLEGLGHRVEEVRPPAAGSFADDFLLYWSMLAMLVTSTGRRTFGPTWHASKLDQLTLGLARHCRRNLQRVPAAIVRLSRSRRLSARFYQTYDVLLTPTVSAETPLLGHLDPTSDYEQTIDRLLDWVAFTPLQNATGEPAISLPLATTASGLPQGMMFGGPAGAEATLLELAYELEEARPFARIQDQVDPTGVSR